MSTFRKDPTRVSFTIEDLPEQMDTLATLRRRVFQACEKILTEHVERFDVDIVLDNLDRHNTGWGTIEVKITAALLGRLVSSNWASRYPCAETDEQLAWAATMLLRRWWKALARAEFEGLTDQQCSESQSGYAICTPAALAMAGEITRCRDKGLSLEGFEWPPTTNTLAPANDPQHPYYISPQETVLSQVRDIIRRVEKAQGVSDQWVFTLSPQTAQTLQQYANPADLVVDNGQLQKLMGRQVRLNAVLELGALGYGVPISEEGVKAIRYSHKPFYTWTEPYFVRLGLYLP